MFNGTGANVVALTSLLPRWGAVVATSTAHIHTDEGGAPEKMTGLKLYTVPTPDGKLTPELIATEAWGWGDEHRAQPFAVCITQTTELGTAVHPRRDQGDRRPGARERHGAPPRRRAHRNAAAHARCAVRARSPPTPGSTS